MFKEERMNFILDRFKKVKMPHAILLNTNDIDKLNEDLSILIKNMICNIEYKNNCSDCNLCHLYEQNSLPNIVKIYPDGLFIKKQQILELIEKFKTKPIYSKYNIYIINSAEKLNLSSANCILKFLEEPEPNIIGFYITDSIQNIIPTIKSRCEIFNIIYSEKKENISPYYDLMQSFKNYVLNKEKNVFFCYKEIFSELNFERKDYIDFIKSLIYSTENKYSNNNSNFELKYFKKIMKILEKTLLYLENNVNIELAILNLVIELRNIYE